MIILVIGNIKHLNHTPYSQESVHVHISARLVSIYCSQSCKNEITSNIEYNRTNKFKLIVIKKVTGTSKVKNF